MMIAVPTNSARDASPDAMSKEGEGELHRTEMRPR